jgi:cytochrome oxidase Cu insertion factor (SCO1/SenC/PrrC family)
VPHHEVPSEAPEFTLEHVLGHKVSLSEFRGRTVLAMFGGKESAEQMQEVSKKVRARYDPEELPILGVSNLEPVPRPARIIAKKLLKKAYEDVVKDETEWLRAAGKEPPDDPAKFVVMLLDWTGDVTRSFGLGDVEHEAVGIVIDDNGRVLGHGAGGDAGDDLVALLPPK